MPGEGAVIGGKYRLARMISEGGGGVVWEAADPDGRAVALKFLKWSPLKSRKVAAERFKNEFAILKSLSHPHISQIYDFGFDASSDQYFFTSELLTAGDLKAMIGEPVAAVEELFLEALRALEYLRGNRLLHLDIKPQNLLLRSGEKPSLAMIDFGLATFRAPDKPGGTANYMPPEMIVRRLDLADEAASYPQADHRSDLYSLGVTFYYILTGIQPFC
ncbi:MAG TPA: serine/threonine-protein kinase, partial [bacterium]|nr:serine/threonine-protein kinase [bacterium]